MHIMYLPSDIIAYIADFCSVTRKVLLQQVCKRFKDIIKPITNLRDRRLYKTIIGNDTKYKSIIIKWKNTVRIDQRIPFYSTDNVHKLLLFNGKSHSMYMYKYGIIIAYDWCILDISDTYDIEYCYVLRGTNWPALDDVYKNKNTCSLAVVMTHNDKLYIRPHDVDLVIRSNKNYKEIDFIH